MRSRRPIAALLLALTACSSAGAPGGQDVLRQVDKAKMTQVEAALTAAATGEAEHLSTQGTYTRDVRALGANPPPDVTLAVVQADETQFCIEATHAGLDGTWHVTNSSATAEGSC